MAVARIVGVVAVAALSALAAYFLYLKSKVIKNLLSIVSSSYFLLYVQAPTKFLL